MIDSRVARPYLDGQSRWRREGRILKGRPRCWGAQSPFVDFALFRGFRDPDVRQFSAAQIRVVEAGVVVHQPQAGLVPLSGEGVVGW
jgi:hypothetical protein